MAGEAPQVRCAAMPKHAVCATSCACDALRPPCGSKPAERWTLWVKRTDVAGARYDLIKHVDSGQLVAELIARWVSDKKLDVEPSLVTLRLVKSGPGVPTASKEAQAAPLEPRLTLSEAGLVDGSSLLACFAASQRSGSSSPGVRPGPGYSPTRAKPVRPPLQLQTAREEAALHESRVRWPPRGCSPAVAAPSRRARRR